MRIAHPSYSNQTDQYLQVSNKLCILRLTLTHTLQNTKVSGIAIEIQGTISQSWKPRFTNF